MSCVYLSEAERENSLTSAAPLQPAQAHLKNFAKSEMLSPSLGLGAVGAPGLSPADHFLDQKLKVIWWSFPDNSKKNFLSDEDKGEPAFLRQN